MKEFAFGKHRAAIVQQWLDLATRDTRPQVARTPTGPRDQFDDPCGHLARACVEAMVDALDNGVNRCILDPPMEGFVKILALQERSPSEALAFVFSIRPVLRQELGLEPTCPEWHELVARVDSIALVAFDIYMRCREKVYSARFNQIQRLHHVMVGRAGVLEGKKQEQEEFGS